MESMTIRWSHLVKRVENVLIVYGLLVKKKKKEVIGALVGGNIKIDLKSVRMFIGFILQDKCRSLHVRW